MLEQRRATTTVADRVHNEKSHRLDAGLISALYGVSVAQIATWSKLQYNTLRKHKDAAIAQPKLASLVHAWEILLEMLDGDESIKRWLHHPIRRLRGKTPIWLLETEGVDAFEGLAEEALAGAYD